MALVCGLVLCRGELSWEHDIYTSAACVLCTYVPIYVLLLGLKRKLLILGLFLCAVGNDGVGVLRFSFLFLVRVR